MIDAAPAKVAGLAEEVAGLEGVAECYSVAGHADIVAVVRVRQLEELAEVVTGRLHRLDGVEDTRTLVAFRSYSKRDLEAMWELGAGEPACTKRNRGPAPEPRDARRTRFGAPAWGARAERRQPHPVRGWGHFRVRFALLGAPTCY